MKWLIAHSSICSLFKEFSHTFCLSGFQNTTRELIELVEHIPNIWFVTYAKLNEV